ncbi:hypothetical protein MY11210_004792 [Beauveria gryllotalpidicola]
MTLFSSLVVSFMASTALGAAISARQLDDPKSCCFHLQDTTSGKHVQQDARTGELFLDDSSLPDGRYCINQKADSKVLYDRQNNACILTSPRNSLECLDAIPGGDTWQLVRNVGEAILLEDYGSIDFNVCNVNGRQQIFGAKPSGGLDCKKTHLSADNRFGQCNSYAGGAKVMPVS